MSPDAQAQELTATSHQLIFHREAAGAASDRRPMFLVSLQTSHQYSIVPLKCANWPTRGAHDRRSVPGDASARNGITGPVP
jgi:hypothetical protein